MSGLNLVEMAAAAVGNASVKCPKAMPATSNGAWQGDSPIHFALPLLIIQICIVLLLSRGIAILLKPLRQPRVIAEIIGGVLLGPSAIGRNADFLNKLFPKQSLVVLDTVAGLGLMFFLFLVGLELDLTSVRRTGRRALAIAAAGITLPFVAGVGVSVVLHNTIAEGVKFAPFLVFMGVAMSITAFPVLARILAELKLLTTEVGQMAMSAAAVNDVVAWVLLALAIALSGSSSTTGNKSPAVVAWVLLSAAGFVVLMFLAVKPAVTWLIRRSGDGQPGELTIVLTLAGVLLSGFITDLIGIHSIFGAFLFGLIIPKEGPFAGQVIEKIEDFVMTLFLPLYFASSGLKTDIGSVHGAQAGGLLVLVVTVACGGKILGTLLVTLLHGVKFRQSLTLGVLMNTKGLVELIVLNIGKDRKVLNDEVFAIMVIMALFTTFITTPIVKLLSKPTGVSAPPYSRRKLDMESRKEEFRLLTCVHGVTHVPSMINLTEASRGTRKRAVRLFILHLVELSERSSAIRLVQRARRDGRPFFNSSVGTQERDEIVVAFEAYAQLSKVTVRPMTAISNLSDMHEDICSTAEDRRVSIIILPFHKYMRVDGVLEGGNAGFRAVNQKVLQHAPCSVAIVVDRGLGGAQRASSTVDHSVAVLFFGGQDDREALVLAKRMAEHPGVKLKVIRFKYDTSAQDQAPAITIPGEEGAAPAHGRSRSGGGRPSKDTYDSYHIVVTGIDAQKQQELDEEALARLQEEIAQGASGGGAPSVVFEELSVHDPVQAAQQIGRSNAFDLIIVGMGRKPAALIANLAHHPAEHAELGLIGDALNASSGPQTKASVVVVQQFDPELMTTYSGGKVTIQEGVNSPDIIGSV